MSTADPTLHPATADRTPLAARQTQEVAQDIAAANLRFIAAFRAGDAAGMASCYTRDAQLLPAQSDVVSGTAAIAAFWKAAMGLGIADARLETAEVEAHGDTAIEVGRYALSGADGGQVDRGKYVVVWHREDGAWRIHRDIWTTSIAPQPSA